MTCALHRGLAHRRRRLLRLRLHEPERARRPVREPLRPEAPVDHALAHQLDRRRVGGVEEEHRRRGAGVRALLALLAQQVPHRDRDVAEVDVHRTGFRALVADGAVVGDVAELVEVPERDAAAGLLLVQERLDQERRREDLVPRRVEQVRARHVRRAHRLALAAAQAVLDRVGDAADLGRLQDQRLGADQVERRRVRVAEVAAGQELPAVEPALGIDLVLVGAERRDLVRLEVLELGDADPVLAGDHPAEASARAA